MVAANEPTHFFSGSGTGSILRGESAFAKADCVGYGWPVKEIGNVGELTWLLLIATSCGFAQVPDQAPKPEAPGRPPVRPAPKPGVCPLPILPALPAYTDTAFYAKTDVPHGMVEEATYKNYAGVDKRMHVYLPPDYSTNARYPVLYLNHGGGGDD